MIVKQLTSFRAVEELSSDELDVRMADVQMEMIDISFQIDEYKASGDYDKPDWYHRTSYALKAKGLEHQNITKALAKRRRAEKREQNNTVERHFINIAKNRLDRAIFDEFMNEALDMEADTAIDEGNKCVT